MKARLTRVILTTALGVLGFTCVALFVFEVRSYRAESARNLATAANIIAENSAGILAFDDKRMAVDVLGGFRAEPGISAAALLDKKGNVYATYPSSLAPEQFADAHGEDGIVTGFSKITVRKPVLQEGARLGTIYVRGNLNGAYERLTGYAIVVLTVGVCSVGVAVLLSRLLQRRIAAPLGSLAATAETITRRKDYGVRAKKFQADEFGELTDAFNAMLDEIQRSSEALRAEEERFRTLADNIAQLAWITEPDGAATWYNKRWFDFTGTTLEEMRGWGWQKVHHPDHAQRVTEKFKTAVASGANWQDVFPLRSKDGEYRWFLSSAFPIRNVAGEVVRWFGTNTDITDQRTAQQRLQAHASRAEVLSKLAAEMFLSDAPRATLKLLLPKIAAALDAEFYLHYSVGAGDGGILEAVGGFPPEDPAGGAISVLGHKLCAACADRKRPVIIEDAQNSADDLALAAKQMGFRAYACYPLKVGDRMLGTVAFASALKGRFEQTELDFIHTVSDLVTASIERARLLLELREARDAAERANTTKDDFLAALSHELRTPLNPVLLVASEGASDSALDPAVREDFAMIAKNVKVEAHLIDDLLDLTKISRGQLLLDTRTVNPHDVLRDALDLVAPEAAEKRIQLVTNLAPGVHVLAGDPIRIQQVFWNVLKNAVKFSPPDTAVAINSMLDTPDGKLTIEIRDSGIGLTAEELTRVFDAFAQGDHATERGSHRFGGLGLGLAISRKLVEMHQGNLRATSAGRGLGATFVIELPVTSNAVKPVEASLEHRPVAVPKARILLVEDHGPSRATLANLLTRRGHTVSTAASVAETLAAAMDQNFDIVVSDIGLPDGSGYTLMAELREKYNLKGIALTGYGAEKDIVQGADAGFLVHLTKPVNVAQLDAAMVSLLGPVSL